MHDCVISKSLVVQKEFVDQDKGDAHLQKMVKGKNIYVLYDVEKLVKLVFHFSHHKNYVIIIQ